MHPAQSSHGGAGWAEIAISDPRFDGNFDLMPIHQMIDIAFRFSAAGGLGFLPSERLWQSKVSASDGQLIIRISSVSGSLWAIATILKRMLASLLLDADVLHRIRLSLVGQTDPATIDNLPRLKMPLPFHLTMEPGLRWVNLQCEIDCDTVDNWVEPLDIAVRSWVAVADHGGFQAGPSAECVPCEVSCHVQVPVIGADFIDWYIQMNGIAPQALESLVNLLSFASRGKLNGLRRVSLS